MDTSSASSAPTLCSVCDSVDFAASLQDPPAGNHFSTTPYLWDLPCVRQSASTCIFCAYLVSILSLVPEFNSFAAGVICAIPETYARNRGGMVKTQPHRLWITACTDSNVEDLRKEFDLRLTISNDRTEDKRIEIIEGHPEMQLFQQAIHLTAKGEWIPEEGDTYRVRALDIYKIKPILIRYWLIRCEVEHAEEMVNKNESVLLEKFRCIDVRDGCVVEILEPIRYLALSYVWGRVEQLQLRSENFKDLTKAKGLWEKRATLPQTIHDAMELTRQLGERFLWVDALCIIQNDQADQSFQIKRMDEVYKNSFLTIVAAAGSDANSGLPRVSGHGSLDAKRIRIRGYDLITSSRQLGVNAVESAWNRRFWTLQEMAFSTRLLIFSAGQPILYSCHGQVWPEDLILESPKLRLTYGDETVNLAMQWLSWRLVKTTVLSTINQLIESSVSRELSYQSDVLNCVRGLLSSLEPGYGPSFWGVPARVFGEFLIWNVKASAKQRDSEWVLGDRREGFPAWSWAGWRYSVDAAKALRLKLWRAGQFSIEHAECPLTFYRFDDERGWICFQTPNSGAQETPVIESKRRLRAWSTVLFSQVAAGCVQERLSGFDISASLCPQLVCFWTSTTPIKVERTLCPMYLTKYRVMGRSGDCIGWLYIPVHIRERLSDEIDFILVCISSGRARMKRGNMLFVIPIEWVDGVAYRIMPDVLWIKEDEWMGEDPARGLILLG